MDQQERGNRGRGNRGRGGSDWHSGRGDVQGTGRGWQQGGRGRPVVSGGRGWQGDGGRGGGQQGDHRGLGVAYGGLGSRGAGRVDTVGGRGVGQPSGLPAPAGEAWNTPRGGAGGVASAWGRGGGRGEVSVWGRGGGRGGRGGPLVASPPAGRAVLPAESEPAASLAVELGGMKISASPSSSDNGRLVPIQRPDRGGSSVAKRIWLCVNNFLLQFDKNMTIYHYDMDVRPENLPEGSVAPEISKSELLAIKTELLRAYAAQFRVGTVAYDGQRNLLSPGQLPGGDFPVALRGRTFVVTLKLVRPVPLEELMQPPWPREIVQGLDVIMRENSSRDRISIGRSFFTRDGSKHRHLGMGVIGVPGFQQSIKPTEQGLALSVDHSAMAFRKPVMVLKYLEERLGIKFNEFTELDGRHRVSVERELKGLKVMVTHREGRRSFTIFGLTPLKANDIMFDVENSESRLRLVDYYRDKYEREIMLKQLPCLELSKNKQNCVPMELCQLVEGQGLPKEKLHRDVDKGLKAMQLLKPWERKNNISNLMEAENGPGRGYILDKFHVSVSHEMARVAGHVLDRPSLKLRDAKGRQCEFNIQKDEGQWNLLQCKVSSGIRIEQWGILLDKGQWNLLQCKVSSGIRIEQWGIADFGPSRHRYQEFDVDTFIQKLVKKCNDLGISMNVRPAFKAKYSMDILSDPRRIRAALDEAKKKGLQILICPMVEKHEGYNRLKLIAETEVGILTQCCLSNVATEGRDQYLANIGITMNAKLGGSNFELYHPLPHMGDINSPVIFIGADVNHPTSGNTTSPSIAAVVASINWPASNRYLSRLQAQRHRREDIPNIGSLCQELIDKFARANKVKPQKIIYFRDGVSDGQFDMVLNEEMKDMKAAIESDGYKPTITVVVAQKRHHTRFFAEERSKHLCTRAGNVPPGTVVDAGIVAPSLFNYYLVSHNGILGTSKPPHYYVLWDENGFTSGEMHRLTYDLCFTFASCTKPISVVPPVYYADLAAYRGRLHYEAMLQSTSCSSSSSVSASHEIVSLPELHTDVKDSMFFI